MKRKDYLTQMMELCELAKPFIDAKLQRVFEAASDGFSLHAVKENEITEASESETEYLAEFKNYIKFLIQKGKEN